VAYQVHGAGPPDIVLVLGAASTSLLWEEAFSTRLLGRLTSFSRLVTFDQRGVGRSDPIAPDRPQTLEERVDDIREVMDAAGLDKAALLGAADGGAASITFAATYPERVTALVLCNTWARLAKSIDYPWGHPPELLLAGQDLYRTEWGTGFSIRYIAPSVPDDPGLRDAWARHEQASASPGQAIANAKVAMELDVRSVLHSVSAPTLVLHTRDNLVAPVDHGRFLAEHIPGASFEELPGPDHAIFVLDSEALLDKVEHFLTGRRQPPRPDRILSTVLFTDIVGSTERAVGLGDRRWAELLDRHHAAVRAELSHFSGREVDTAGDSFLATFDGPGRAIQCASAIARALLRLGIRIRAGIHTGECELTPTGLAGLAVHIGARVAAKAEAGEVLVSQTVKDLVVGSGIEFVERGLFQLKGVPGEWRLFAVAT
jgi:pimeloyl-ACP methyl ester carboxylesterase